MESIPAFGFADPVASWLHLGGAFFFLLLAPRLLYKGHGHAGRLLSLSVFVSSVLLLLMMSGVYHWLENPYGRALMRRVDHAAIFVLIAGTFTPAHSILFKGFMRWGVLVFVWTTAIVSLTLKTVFFEGFPEWLGLSMYLSLGWFGLLSGSYAWRRYGFVLMRPMLFGGLAYTFGALLEFLRWPTLWPGVIGPHELFHAAVLIGISYHWWFIFRFAHGTWDPRPSRVVRAREAKKNVNGDVDGPR